MLEQIKCFLEVANCLSFTKAAEKTFVTQQAVTRSISSLEKELGVKLLNRSTRYVTLTEAGIICRDEFTKLIENFEQVVKKARKVSLANKSSVTIGFNEFFSRTDIITPTMEMITEAFPDVDFTIKLYDFVTLRQQLLDEKIDLGITMSCYCDWVWWPSVKVTPLLKQPFKIVVSKKHPLAAFDELQLESLKNYTWVAFDNIDFVWINPPRWLSMIPCKAKVSVGNYLAILANIEASYSFSCITPVYMDIKNKSFKYFSLPFDNASADFICVHREDMINPLVLEIAKLIRQNFKVSLIEDY